MSQRQGDRSALVLMDLQAGIVDSYADGDFLMPIQRAIDAARRADLPLIWVVVRFRSGYPEASVRNQLFCGIRGTGRCTEDDPQAEIHPVLQRKSGEVIVTKRRAEAFCGSDLGVVLRSAQIDSLILAGIATSGVVLSTVRRAADLDYRLTVLRDGCCDSGPEVHRVLTE